VATSKEKKKESRKDAKSSIHLCLVSFASLRLCVIPLRRSPGTHVMGACLPGIELRKAGMQEGRKRTKRLRRLFFVPAFLPSCIPHLFLGRWQPPMSGRGNRDCAPRRGIPTGEKPQRTQRSTETARFSAFLGKLGRSVGCTVDRGRTKIRQKNWGQKYDERSTRFSNCRTGDLLVPHFLVILVAATEPTWRDGRSSEVRETCGRAARRG
jgi:hypothetical protein